MVCRFLLLCGLLLMPAFAAGAADSVSAETAEFTSAEPINRAYALVLRRLAEPKVEKYPALAVPLSGNKWRVSVHIKDEPQGSLESVVLFAVTASGKVIFSEVREPSLRSGQASPGSKSCASDPAIFDASMFSSFTEEEMKAFFAVKRQRVKQLQERIRSSLNAERLRRLNSLEADSGLLENSPLRADTPVEDLVRRLARISSVHQPRQ